MANCLRGGGFWDGSICRGKGKPFPCHSRNRTVWAKHRKKAGAARCFGDTEELNLAGAQKAQERESQGCLEVTQSMVGGGREATQLPLELCLAGTLQGKSHAEAQGWQTAGRDSASALMWEGHSSWQEKIIWKHISRDGHLSKKKKSICSELRQCPWQIKSFYLHINKPLPHSQFHLMLTPSL